MPKADLAVIIVSYNTRVLIQECLESIYKHLTDKIVFEIVVIDNNSTDGSVEFLNYFTANKSEISLILSDQNQGFAKANNLGIRRADARFVLLLNSDAFLVDDSALEIIRYMEANSDVFACGCDLLNRDGSRGPAYGNFPHAFTLLKEVATNRFGSLRARTAEGITLIREIDFPCGAFFLINGELLKKIGELDDGFFMYYEEAELALRAKKAGYSIKLYPNARAMHIGGASSGGYSVGPLTVVFYQSWRRFLCKHFGQWQSQLVMLILMSHFSVRFIRHLLFGRGPGVAYYKGHLQAVRKAWSSLESRKALLGSHS